LSRTTQVNGASFAFEAEPLRPALDVLRGLGFLSVRETCGLGVCGTCTIFLSGVAVSSCLVPAFRLEGASVETTEGLSSAGALHPIQQAFVDEQAFQCSFCTPGFLLATRALLAERDTITEDDLDDYLGGHLCRCGSYLKIRSAIERAALAAGKRWSA
jgi:aerobic-type carbon monoxide dehydrogenase small subunit (CoxS/CutS family)